MPDILKGSGEVRIATFGGTMQDTQTKAYFEPFEKISGIKVQAFPGSNPTKIKAMVETRNIEWDMAQLSRGTILNMQKTGDYFEKIDYSIVDDSVDKATASNTASRCCCGRRSAGLSHRRAERRHPRMGWADFWDTKKFPGDRAMVGTGNGGWPELEFALMAAGVPPDKLYPIDIDKAFASYDKIKKDVVKWWDDTGAMPIQLLTDREVVMTSVWNGRMAALQAAGVPAQISWNQGLLKRDAWGIPKGAKNKDNAHEVRRLFDDGDPAGAASRSAFPTARSTTIRTSTFPPSARSCCRAPLISSRTLVTYNYDWWIGNRFPR